MDKLYRVLNEVEQLNTTYDSNKNLSSRKRCVISFLPQILNICILSAKCKIKLASALKIASQYGWVIETIQNYRRNGKSEIPLDLFLVDDEGSSFSL
ncbi:MAG: hypothetical protein WCR36_07305 [Bacteroidaceae bacterium]